MSAPETFAADGPAPRQRRTWDLVLAIALLALLVALAAVLGVAGAFLAMASDPCGGSVVCRTDQLGAGVLIAMLGPAVVALVAIAAVVERIVHARLAFWVPLAGAAIALLVWGGGAGLVFGAVPTS